MANPTDSEQRYLVQGPRALRFAPFGLSVYEFVWEWLRLDDSNAARFSSPDAAAQHHSVMTVEMMVQARSTKPNAPELPIARISGGVDHVQSDLPTFASAERLPRRTGWNPSAIKPSAIHVVLPPPQADTVTFAQHMRRYRTSGGNSTAAESNRSKPIFAWLDARVTTGMTIERMNIELSSGEIALATIAQMRMILGRVTPVSSSTSVRTPVNADGEAIRFRAI